MAFHEVRFPTAISLGSSGGPERRTEIVTLGSGAEERNQRWADSRRRYDAGYGVKRVNDLYVVIEFFEERRGRFHSFRWKDHADFKSCLPTGTPSSTDQSIGTGDGVEDEFQLVKAYGYSFAPWSRTISKPVAGTVRVAVDGVEQVEGPDWTVDTATGIVTFDVGSIPGGSTAVTAGYEFDVPVRFDADQITVNLANFAQGDVPSIPIVEILV